MKTDLADLHNSKISILSVQAIVSAHLQPNYLHLSMAQAQGQT